MKTGILVYGGILKITLSRPVRIGDDKRKRDDFDVHLYALPWIGHLFVWFRDIFWVRRFYVLHLHSFEEHKNQ